MLIDPPGLFRFEFPDDSTVPHGNGRWGRWRGKDQMEKGVETLKRAMGFVRKGGEMG
jgi:hypothetical protein